MLRVKGTRGLLIPPARCNRLIIFEFGSLAGHEDVMHATWRPRLSGCIGKLDMPQ